MDNLQLEYISFRPIKPVGSLIGFISFKIGKDYSWHSLGIHALRVPKKYVKIRLLYPEKQHPENKIMQEEIDEAVNSYLLAQYPEVMKGI